MSLFRTIMDRMSKGSFSVQEDTDIRKVIEERDRLQTELSLLTDQYAQLFDSATGMLEAKNDIIAAATVLAEENRMLREALGIQQRVVKTTEGMKN